jgi:hypothetical protein
MLKRMSDAHRLLDMLAGCPDGITQYTLMTVHGFAPSLLYRCIDLNLITVREQVVGSRRGLRSMTVFRFYISEDGRASLNSGAGCG